MSHLPARKPSDDRHCGACTACCAYLATSAGVVAPGCEPSLAGCPHAGVLGCRIHGRKPKICSSFVCLWLRDPLWPPAWRPDRLGILCFDEPLEDRRSAATVCEIRPAALVKPEAADLLNHLLRTTVAVAILDVQRRPDRMLAKTAPRSIADLPWRMAG